ncbi:hypothetical protein [Paenibacillus sp. QZ-Y1]|uniref:hypothetical protein n=1 Tax=Paenibacillus sp. QZ-Y1 TaxID=3414511 RepID=UPI003F78E42A
MLCDGWRRSACCQAHRWQRRSRPSLTGTITGRASLPARLPASLREGRELYSPSALVLGLRFPTRLPAPLHEGREPLVPQPV